MDNEVIFVIGLPGSGKSTLLEYYKSHPFIEYEIFDDWGICNLDKFEVISLISECRYNELLQVIRENKNVIITCIDFCKTEFINESENYLKSEFPNITIQKIYFENNLEYVINNIKVRDKKRGGYWKENEKGEYWYYGLHLDNIPQYKKEIENAKLLSSNYLIPKEYKPLKIKFCEYKNET